MATSNVCVVNLEDGRQVCLSYGMPVAAFIPGLGYVKTAARYSVTSSRHANTFCHGAGTGAAPIRELPDEEFRRHIAPIVGGGL